MATAITPITGHGIATGMHGYGAGAKIDILLSPKGRGFLRSPAGFAGMTSVGSSHNRLTSAEDNEEALLLGYPPIGLVDQGSLRGCNNQGRPYILGRNAEALRPKKGKSSWRSN